MLVGTARLAIWLPLFLLFAYACPSTVSADTAPIVDQLETETLEDESLLITAFHEIHEHRLDNALSIVEDLVQRNPKFRLAQLVYADLLSAKTRPIRTLGSDLDNDLGVATEKLSELRQEARMRLKHHLARPKEGAVPEQLLQLSESQRRAVVVDVAASRLYLFENHDGAPKLTGDYYVATGKNGAMKLKTGDLKTPLGVYFITNRITRKKLPDLYGSGAFPVNYPNEWDRRHRRTGHGIWLHGVPSDTYSRPPRATKGCIALPNADLESMWDLLEIGRTPVIIADEVNWIEKDALPIRRDNLRANIERWRRDWESLDHERYASHYSRDFNSGTKDYGSWLRHKRRVNAGKEFVNVQLSDLSVFSYPSESLMMVVTFEQDYQSNNFRRRSTKRQYWRFEGDGVWRIIYEGNA